MRSAVDSPATARYSLDMQQFLEVLTQADNVPIAAMLLLVLFFTWVGFRQALRNDRLIQQGREDEVLKEMQR